MKLHILLASLLVTAAALAGCSSNEDTQTNSSGGDVQEGPLTIEMIENQFAPKDVRIRAGTTVTWVNKDDMGHTVTPDDAAQWGTPGSGDAPEDWMNKDDTWSWTFSKPGTYKYHCFPHATKAGSGYLGMIGTITVV